MINHLRQIFLFFSFLFIGVSQKVCAQDFYSIQLQDAETNEPVSYATIRFSDTNRGLVADFYGQFRLPVELSKDIEELIITSIGYSPLQVKISSLKSNTLNVFQLSPQVEVLDAVVLNTKKSSVNPNIADRRKLLALDIVARAVSFIRVNLNEKPHSSIGYYRDYQSLGKGTYYNLNEGILEQFDGGIRTNKITSDKNQAAFYQFRPNLSFPRDSALASSYDDYNKFLQGADILNFGGNELSILNVHNPIRLFDANSFSFIYRIQYEFLENHLFSKEGIVYDNEDPIITIAIEGRDKKVPPSHRVDGYIKISLADFAIHQLKYTVYERNRDNPLFNVDIQYRKLKGKMYLNYMTFNNRFISRDRNVFKEDSIVFNKENNSFTVHFNRPAEIATLKKRNFKIYFKNRKLSISKLIIDDTKTITLVLPDYEQDLRFLNRFRENDLRFVIRRVKDQNGKVIYREYNRVDYQFREFFVQEIFEDKMPNKNLKCINKIEPLSKAPVNLSGIANKYIVNSPLKNISL